MPLTGELVYKIMFSSSPAGRGAADGRRAAGGRGLSVGGLGADGGRNFRGPPRTADGGGRGFADGPRTGPRTPPDGGLFLPDGRRTRRTAEFLFSQFIENGGREADGPKKSTDAPQTPTDGGRGSGRGGRSADATRGRDGGLGADRDVFLRTPADLADARRTWAADGAADGGGRRPDRRPTGRRNGVRYVKRGPLLRVLTCFYFS